MLMVFFMMVGWYVSLQTFLQIPAEIMKESANVIVCGLIIFQLLQRFCISIYSKFEKEESHVQLVCSSWVCLYPCYLYRNFVLKKKKNISNHPKTN